nr:MAG TPA: hypothetical protein [Caudoviricetes sp.]
MTRFISFSFQQRENLLVQRLEQLRNRVSFLVVNLAILQHLRKDGGGFRRLSRKARVPPDDNLPPNRRAVDGGLDFLRLVLRQPLCARQEHQYQFFHFSLPFYSLPISAHRRLFCGGRRDRTESTFANRSVDECEKHQKPADERDAVEQVDRLEEGLHLFLLLRISHFQPLHAVAQPTECRLRAHDYCSPPKNTSASACAKRSGRRSSSRTDPARSKPFLTHSRSFSVSIRPSASRIVPSFGKSSSVLRSFARMLIPAKPRRKRDLSVARFGITCACANASTFAIISSTVSFIFQVPSKSFQCSGRRQTQRPERMSYAAWAGVAVGAVQLL